MKQALSALELRALSKELEGLVGAKINQIYSLEEGDLLLQLHIPSVGKEIVRIKPPFALYRGANKGTIEGVNSAFCTLLRQKVSNQRIWSQKQHGFDRIWMLTLGHSEIENHLIIEFFGKGNVILTDDKMKIIGALDERSFGVRSTKSQAVYQFPTTPIDPFLLDEKKLSELLLSSDKNQLVKALALSLGGQYGEELCLRAGLEKSISPSKLTPQSCRKIYQALRSFEEFKPQVVFMDFAPHDVVVEDFAIYEGFDKKYFDTFSLAQALFWSAFVPQKKPNPRRQRLETMMAEQKRHYDLLLVESKESQQKGELIYLHYPLVKEALTALKEAGKTIGWKEAKKRLNKHPLVKDIDEKKGQAELELQ